MNNPWMKFVAGEELQRALWAEKDQRVKKSSFRAGCYDSESLCEWQRELSHRGIRGVELVQSMYGVSVRADSGLQDFALLASSKRMGNVDGTFEDATRWAKEWVAQDPTRRYAWFRDQEFKGE